MYTTGLLTQEHFKWAVQVAGKNMIVHELKRPELLHRESLEALANKMMVEGTGVLAFYNGRPVGAIGGVLVPHIFNPNITVLSELLWYVLPEFRNGRAGLLLIKEFKKLVDLYADEATLSTLPTSDVKTETLAKLGFHYGEKAFYYIKEK